jgi:hypothetical protein
MRTGEIDILYGLKHERKPSYKVHESKGKKPENRKRTKQGRWCDTQEQSGHCESNFGGSAMDFLAAV